MIDNVRQGHANNSRPSVRWRTIDLRDVLRRYTLVAPEHISRTRSRCAARRILRQRGVLALISPGSAICCAAKRGIHEAVMI
ncbi:MAG TPA: hypothetical protein VHW23_02855 [Kofleriaceae bacterium]|jgi:hypothetical protein|nr:hypothetical protein [Kofleriaceae bacterium]